MKKIAIIGLILINTVSSFSQEEKRGTDDNTPQSSNEKLLNKTENLTIGGYGQIDYNQELNKDYRSVGNLDVHRMVMLFGYRFNERTQFVTELEFEHVKELYVEQAFLQYKINSFLNFRGGLMLTPMGLINEYHEPTAYNGVERPLIDKYITPTTWREIGAGFTGNIIDAAVKYQAYLMNGFSSYDGSAKLDGKNGLRKGRQKGAESFISSPNFAGKIEYYGFKNLNIGLSGYFGETQSSLYDGIDLNDEQSLSIADSSIVGVSMIGFDARYNFKALQIKGQFYHNALSNTEQYNVYTATDSIPNDLGSSMLGYYLEIGYNIFKHIKNSKTELIPFFRYEAFDTQNSMANGCQSNENYSKTILTTGLGWKLSKGAVLKADVQFVKSEADTKYAKMLNAGIGVAF